MARIVCMGRGPSHLTGAKLLRAYKIGDVVQVFEDGAELGTQVEPSTAPDDSPFVVLEIPGPKSDYLYLMADHRGPLHIETEIGHPDFGLEVQDDISKRQHQIDLNLLPAQVRTDWDSTRLPAPAKLRLPVVVATQVLFEVAVLDKETGNPINPLTIPRGKKR